MVCVCDRRKSFAIETHKSMVSVFSSVGVCGKGTLELVWVSVCVYFKFVSKVDSVKRNGSKYTIYTSCFSSSSSRNFSESLAQCSDLVSNSFCYTLLIFFSVLQEKMMCCFAAVRNYLFFVTKYSGRKNRIFTLHYFILLLVKFTV